MQLTSLWDKPVEWFVYNEIDRVYLFPDGNGTLPPHGGAGLPGDKMQLRIKEVGGATLAEPSPNRLYSISDNLVLTHGEFGQSIVRSFARPILLLMAPTAGASLTQSRLGLPDRATLVLNMRDLGELVDIADYLLLSQAIVAVRQAAQSDYEVRAVRVEGQNSNILATFTADLHIPYSGPATIFGQIRNPSPSANFSSNAIEVSVAPTGPRAYHVTLNGQTLNGAQINMVPNQPVAVIIRAPVPGVYENVRIQTSLDNFGSTQSMGDSAIEDGTGTYKWSISISIGPNQPPGQYILRVLDEDIFNVPSTVDFTFITLDVTGPYIDITSPPNGQVFIAETVSSTQPYTVVVGGRVTDSQSGYRAGSLSYTFDGTKKKIDVNSEGSWWFSIPVTTHGAFTFRLDAADNSSNPAFRVWQFNVRSSFKPESIDQLLSPRAYLEELLRFVGSHVTTDSTTGSPVTSQLLAKRFAQPFGELAQLGTLGAEQPINDLLTPVRLLRKSATLESAGLVARYSFDEANTGTTVLKERGGRFSLDGQYFGGAVTTSDPALEGGIVIDKDHYAVVDQNTELLEVGKDNADFTVAFWIYLQSRPDDDYHGILFKGDPAEETTGNITARTFCLWLHPKKVNKIHFRISTKQSADEGGNSNTELSLNRWTHLAYVLSGRSLKLYIDGRLDAEVGLRGKVISNTLPLVVGRAYVDKVSFNGALDELRIYALALDAEDVRQLALDRHGTLSETPLTDYHRVAYETLLSGLGTSFEEIRTLSLMTRSQRELLAKRLGLWIGRNGVTDRLDALLPDSTIPLPGNDGYELWLANRFGLPMTINFETATTHPCEILSYRQKALAAQWLREDDSRTLPDLDPDLVEIADLSPGAEAWTEMLRLRAAQLANKFQEFAVTLSPGDAVAQVLVAPSDQAFLLQLETKEAAGEDIGNELLSLRLDRPMFRRLLAYLHLLALSVPFSTHEREDLAHLLVQVWKTRTQYTGWRNAELYDDLLKAQLKAQQLWPNFRAGSTPEAAAWVPGNFKASFLPWRASAGARAELEARLNGRLRAWQALADNQSQAVADAQRAALPVLRDGLLGVADLPDAGAKVDNIAERWLMDFSTAGATQLTPIEQASASLQTLVNGVRGGWYETAHPAHGWAVAGTNFDEQWAWLDSYGRWQTAVTNYLYPENVLYPELKDDSETIKKFLKELGKLQPLSTEVLKLNSQAATPDKPATPYKVAFDAVAEPEKYFAYVAIGLAFQRQGLYTAALDQYHQVYDPSQSTPGTRKLKAPLKSEPDNQAPNANFGDNNWTASLGDPHQIATDKRSGSSNPYTRFTLFQILHCILGQADDAFASGTRDGRTRALGLYLEANDILNFEELRDLQPTNPRQAYLPSPVLASLRAHTASALRKLRNGLSYLGTPLPPDLTRGAGGGAVSSLVRPTPYRYRVLMERAKQLTTQAQQLEAQYLSAIVGGDAETEKYLTSGFAVDTAKQTVDLRTLQATEAENGKELATRQQARSQIQKDRYSAWIAAGQTANEKSQIDNLWAAKTAKDVIAGIDATIASTQAIVAGIEFSKILTTAGGAIASTTVVVAGSVAKGFTQGFLNDNETRSQVSGILAGQERRTQEWQLQSDLAAQDVQIGQQQITLAQDRIAITTQESLIANSQLANAKQMLAFLSVKFTSAVFYQWLIGELSQIYATFLRLATVTAQHAELQIAFERQESPARLIKADYWLAASKAAASAGTSGTAGKTIDPRGITGSARLLQDLYTLDDYAFTSERRLLNLTQSFSLARLMPIEFEEFRRTGLLAFATPMQWFDEGFPGHYMRLIKKVRVSVAALIPPSIGIRATLANGGMSRVVTADPGYPTMVIRQNPQMVALTSPLSSTGVFELDTQSDLLYPFEGTGVDTTWYLELPPAGNPFDFESLMDVVLSIDYTAQFSSDVRDRAVKQLPRQFYGDRSYSIKRDFPDTWYDLANVTATTASVTITVPVSRRSFPPGLTQLQVVEVLVSVRATDGSLCAFNAKLKLTLSDTVKPESSVAACIKGIASSRQTGGASWHSWQPSGGGSVVKVLDAITSITDAEVQFAFELSNQDSASPFIQQLIEGKVDDILVVMTLTGTRPAWG